MERSFSDACLIVQMAYERNWPAVPAGHFMVENYGWGDDDHYLVIVGTREWLRDKNPRFLPPDDDTAVFVRKDNGAIEEVNPMMYWDKIDAMTPIGNHPKDDDE